MGIDRGHGRDRIAMGLSGLFAVSDEILEVLDGTHDGCEEVWWGCVPQLFVGRDCRRDKRKLNTRRVTTEDGIIQRCGRSGPSK